MSQAAVESFLGRIITDVSFNAKAARSLESVSIAEGFNLSEEEKSYLKKMDFALFAQVAESIDDAIKRG